MLYCYAVIFMVIMAVDYGKSRTGLAVCDSMEIIASPVGIIAEKDFDKCLEKVADEVKARKAELIVVGLPKRTDGKVGETEELATKFSERLGEMTGTETVLWNEVFTTVSAHQALNEMNVRGKKRKAVVDALAAVIILESYLNRRHNTV